MTVNNTPPVNELEGKFFLSVVETHKLTGLRKETIRRACNLGTIPGAKKITMRKWLIPKAYVLGITKEVEDSQVSEV